MHFISIVIPIILTPNEMKNNKIKCAKIKIAPPFISILSSHPNILYLFLHTLFAYKRFYTVLKILVSIVTVSCCNFHRDAKLFDEFLRDYCFYICEVGLSLAFNVIMNRASLASNGCKFQIFHCHFFFAIT